MSMLPCEGILANGSAFCLYGVAVNGAIEQIGEHAYLIGEDAAAVLPKHNVAVVFDGTVDPLHPARPRAAKRAAISAVHAVIEYFNTPTQTDPREALVCADRAIRNDGAHGLCVGTITHLDGPDVHNSTIGDAATLLLERQRASIAYVESKQQAHTPHYLGLSGSDSLRREDIPNTARSLGANDELYCISDGVLSGRTCYEENIFDAAHGDLQRFDAAIVAYPELEQSIREYIARQDWNDIVRDQTDSFGTYEGPAALINPAAFTLESIDWALWIAAVRPYVHTLRIPPQDISPASILRAIIHCRIGRDSIYPQDDATAIMIAPA